MLPNHGFIVLCSFLGSILLELIPQALNMCVHDLFCRRHILVRRQCDQCHLIGNLALGMVIHHLGRFRQSKERQQAVLILNQLRIKMHLLQDRLQQSRHIIVGAFRRSAGCHRQQQQHGQQQRYAFLYILHHWYSSFLMRGPSFVRISYTIFSVFSSTGGLFCMCSSRILPAQSTMAAQGRV